MRRPFATYRLLAVLVLTLATASCTEEVAAPLGTEEPFSMYGILIPTRSFQTIGVAPIEPLLYDYPEKLDVTVTSTDLETGQLVVWRDSVAGGERGQRDHVFWAEFFPEYGRSYRIDAMRSDGATTSAVARIPRRVTVEAGADAEDDLVMAVTGESFRLNRIEVIYKLGIVDVFNPDPCASRRFTHVMDYTGDETAVGNGYRFDVNLELDHSIMENRYVLIPGRFRLALMGMSVRMLVGEPAWAPPGGAFDENTLGHPDVMTNTTNGFGLVAGGYEYRRAAYPSEQVIAETKFADYMIRPPADCFDYCSCRPG